MARDFYEILQVDRRATDPVIKAAYHALATKVHPDHGGSRTAFQRVSEAYETLSDEVKRKAYANRRRSLLRSDRHTGGRRKRHSDL